MELPLPNHCAYVSDNVHRTLVAPNHSTPSSNSAPQCGIMACFVWPFPQHASLLFFWIRRMLCSWLSRLLVLYFMTHYSVARFRRHLYITSFKLFFFCLLCNKNWSPPILVVWNGKPEGWSMPNKTPLSRWPPLRFVNTRNTIWHSIFTHYSHFRQRAVHEFLTSGTVDNTWLQCTVQRESHWKAFHS